MNKILISVTITWLFVLVSIWMAQSEYSKLNNFKTRIYHIERQIDNLECKKLYKSGLIEMVIHYNNEQLSYFPSERKNLSLSKRCKMQMDQFGQSKIFKAILLKDWPSNLLLDLYLDSKHVVILKKEIKKRQNDDRLTIVVALGIGIFITVINFFVWYFKIDVNKIVVSKKFQWLLYFIAIYAVLSYLLIET